MTRPHVGVPIAAFLLLSAPTSFDAVAAQAHGDRCEYRTELASDLSASDSDRLRVSAGSGELVVSGRSGATRVSMTATLCASEEWMLQDMAVEFQRHGSTVDLRTIYPDDAWRHDGYARIDLRVDVPLGMPAEIDDGSGSATLSGLGDLTVEDGSGELLVEHIRGMLDVEDGSGGLEIRDVTGDVFVDDGSGSMDIVGVTGSVTLDDGSGSVEIRNVGENVLAYDLGSGTLWVTEVGGDFTVREGRHERIRYSGVKGTVDIPAPRKRRRGRP